VLAFSGTAEKSGANERKESHRGDYVFSPHVNVENGVSWKWFALLGILRKELLKERTAPALTNGP
jgi:hypothetical protein